MMTIGNIFLLSQSAVYTVSAIVSLCVLIPIGENLYQFCDHCLLFTTGQYIEEDGTFDPNWSSPGYCWFTVCVGLAVFFVATIQAIRKFIKLCKGIDSTFLSVFIEALIGLILTIMVLIDALIVTKGFAVWCQSVSQRFDSCETASSVMTFGTTVNIDPNGFFIQFGAIQFGLWTLQVCWVLSLVLAARKLFIYHEMENMIVSMTRERQRHIGNDYSTMTT